MKIIVTADPELPVPPILYGGIERIIDGLIQQYTKDGHTVVLVAKKGSACRHANKKYNWIGKSSRNGFDILVNAIQLAIIYLKEKPDVIHSFSRLLYLYPLFLSTKAKVVQSYQRAISYKSTSIAARISKGRLIFTACAAHMFESLPNKEKWHAVYNFTDTDYFVPDLTAPKNYLFFLGRLEPIKGIKEAIEIAKTTQEDLVIAGNIPREYEQYYTQEIKPQLSDKIRYIGPVNDEQKKNLFHNFYHF